MLALQITFEDDLRRRAELAKKIAIFASLDRVLALLLLKADGGVKLFVRPGLLQMYILSQVAHEEARILAPEIFSIQFLLPLVGLNESNG